MILGLTQKSSLPLVKLVFCGSQKYVQNGLSTTVLEVHGWDWVLDGKPGGISKYRGPYGALALALERSVGYLLRPDDIGV